MFLKKCFCILLLGYCQFVQAQPIEKILSSLTSVNQKLDTLHYFGRKYHMKAMPDSAKWYYKEGLKLAKQTKNNSDRIVRLYTSLSRVGQMQRDPQGALATINEAKLFIDGNTSKGVLQNHSFLTATYFRLLLKYDSALYYYHEAEKIGNSYRPYGRWFIYDGIAELFLASEDYEKAEEYYLKAYNLTKAGGVRMDHGLIINRLGNLYSKLNNAEKFAEILREFQQFNENKKRDFQKDALHSLLFINWGNKTLKEKVTLLESAKKLHIKNGYISAAALANYQIASIYEENDQPEEGLKYLYENRNFFIEQSAVSERYPNLKYIYELEVKTGKTADALLTANQLLGLIAKLTDHSNKELAFELEKKYETAKKEKEIELLNSQNQLSAIELLREADIRQALERENFLMDATITQQNELTVLTEREKDLQFRELEKEKQLSVSLVNENTLKEKLLADDKNRKKLLLSGMGLLIIAGLVILYQYRRQLSKNKIINKQRDGLVMLNQEMHHRVKNNLQIISSLLDLQSATTDDEKTAEKFREGSQRVQSMAFVHQNLYQGEDPGTIDIQQYIKMLTDNLMQSYNTMENKITLNTDVEAIRLHSDTVIPIGLIINELVSNSLKYAFKNKPNGEINVVLKKSDKDILLQVKDNGIGIPDSKSVTSGPSFGYKIIQAFAQKLKALVTINSSNGTDVQIRISKYRTT